jgi:hypothetical protein
LSEVTPSHIWRPSDVKAVRAKLQEICTNAPTFSASLVKWTQAIIDELNAAINECVTCSPHADDGIAFGPIPLIDYPYGANGWHLHYFDPSQYQVGRSGIKGREATIVASPEYGSDYIKTYELGILCNGYLNLGDWSPPAGDTSAARVLVAEGLLPVIDTPGPRTITASITIDLGANANSSWLRCASDCSQPDYLATIGGSINGMGPLASRWYPSLDAVNAGLAVYNSKHTQQLQIASTTKYSPYGNPTIPTGAWDDCYMVSLAYV